MAFRLQHDPEGVTPPPSDDANVWQRLVSQLGRAITDPTAGAGIELGYVPRYMPPMLKQAARYLLEMNPERQELAQQAGEFGPQRFTTWFDAPSHAEANVPRLDNPSSYFSKDLHPDRPEVYTRERPEDFMEFKRGKHVVDTGDRATGPTPRYTTPLTGERHALDSLMQYLEDALGPYGGPLTYKPGRVVEDIPLPPDPRLRGQSSRIAVNPSEMDPNRYSTVREHRNPFNPVGYFEEKFPEAVKLRVEQPGALTPETAELLHAMGADRSVLDFAGPQAFEDGIKGLNPGHALRRAADSWPEATRIQITGKDPTSKPKKKPK